VLAPAWRSYFIAFFLLFSAHNSMSQGAAPTHEAFTSLLKKHVSVNGQVNYKGFMKDSVALNQYLKVLSSSTPNSRTWSKQEQMAFWINAYNAFTIKLILKHYPVKSIKDIGSKIQIPFVNTPWDIKFITIGSEKLDLNNIEHEKLRKAFGDPRVHMVLVCASKSCPVLLNEAFNSSQLENQLDRQTRVFLTDSFRNKVAPESLQISQIFNWYKMDFTQNGNSVQTFISTYSGIKVKSGAKITYLEYDWDLNE
jgi:hypothetical protein